MAMRKKETGTLADQAYRLLKQAILRGEMGEGVFLSEADVTARFRISRTPFREACNRLHNEQLLEVVPRRGYLVPEMSFRAVRDLIETRLILEGVAVELAAQRAEPAELDELDRLQKAALRARPNLEESVRANTEFHLQLGRLSHNRELESLLRGVLERSMRLFYQVARAAVLPEREDEDLLRPIVNALRKKNAEAARKAVVRDITQGQLHVLGGDLWEKQK